VDRPSARSLLLPVAHARRSAAGRCFGGRQIKMPKTTPCTVAKSLTDFVFPKRFDLSGGAGAQCPYAPVGSRKI
jgi:hypothetical protein